MRDPKRIDRFCNELKAMWATVPDWRFGQLVINVLGAYAGTHHRDFFSVEDDDMLEYMRKYFFERASDTTCGAVRTEESNV